MFYWKFLELYTIIFGKQKTLTRSYLQKINLKHLLYPLRKPQYSFYGFQLNLWQVEAEQAQNSFARRLLELRVWTTDRQCYDQQFAGQVCSLNIRSGTPFSALPRKSTSPKCVCYLSISRLSAWCDRKTRRRKILTWLVLIFLVHVS